MVKSKNDHRYGLAVATDFALNLIIFYFQTNYFDLVSLMRGTDTSSDVVYFACFYFNLQGNMFPPVCRFAVESARD